MQYALLIYTDERADNESTKEQQAAVTAAYNAFGEQYKDKIVGGEALLPTASATTVRLRDAKALTTDGPFAETKEVLGGYYLIDVDSLDEALEWGAKVPGAKYGTIEVRPVVTDYETVA
jgi:hypothetical protein